MYAYIFPFMENDRSRAFYQEFGEFILGVFVYESIEKYSNDRGKLFQGRKIICIN